MANALVIQIEALGQTQMIAKLSRLGESLKDARPALEETGAYLKGHVLTRFNDEGPGWAPLSRAYAEWKSRMYPGAPILVRTEAMRSAFSSSSVYQISGDTLHFGVNIPSYTNYHQLGTRRMSKRSLVQLDSPRRAEIGKIFQKWAVKQAREAGLS